MNDLVVLIVEDEPDVRQALVRDLDPLGELIRIDESESVDDALAALTETETDGDVVGLVLADHRLPGRSGVDLLVGLHHDPATTSIRKVLITGQAGHEDTIRAINDAALNRYIAKPWDPQELLAISIEQLTDFVIERGLDPLRYASVLDSTRLIENYSRHPHAE